MNHLAAAVISRNDDGRRRQLITNRRHSKLNLRQQIALYFFLFLFCFFFFVFQWLNYDNQFVISQLSEITAS